MEAKNRTINEMIAQMITEARKRGYSEAAIGRKIILNFKRLLPTMKKEASAFMTRNHQGVC